MTGVLFFMLVSLVVAFIIRWRLKRPWSEFLGIIVATEVGLAVIGWCLFMAIGLSIYVFASLLAVGSILVLVYYGWRLLRKGAPTKAT